MLTLRELFVSAVLKGDSVGRCLGSPGSGGMSLENLESFVTPGSIFSALWVGPSECSLLRYMSSLIAAAPGQWHPALSRMARAKGSPGIPESEKGGMEKLATPC